MADGAATLPREPQPIPPLEPGTSIAPGYGVLGLLHRTANLDVYDVWSEERACRCVAKAVNPNRDAQASGARHLRREGQMLLELAHPHIVRAYELLDEPRPILVLETLPGATVQYLIEGRGRRFPLAGLAYLGLHLGSAMHYLHRHGYLHRDLKPSNVISDRGLAKVIDFSIARPIGTGQAGVGTRRYMAPEQARGGPLDERADVWGIGVVLYEAAAGRQTFRAYRGDRYDQLERRADPIRTHRRLPARLAELIDGCLEPEPERRPTVDELLGMLAGLV